MASCKNCGISGRNNKPRCWSEYQLCMKCCATIHPEIYPENIVLKAIGNQAIRRNERLIKICPTCNTNIKKLAFSTTGKRKPLNVGFCTVCAEIVVYDKRLKVRRF